MWGPPTWQFLHSLGEVIHPDHYNAVKTDLWKHVVELCRSVPCPDCAFHADAYLSKIPVPPNKDAFRGALWTFHNTVNIKSGKPIFPREKLAMYRIPTPITFTRCKYAMKKQPYNPLLMIHKMKTGKALDSMESWLKNNRLI